MVKIEIDPIAGIAKEIWEWNGPIGYYSPVFGDADVLPNGNYFGTFGTGSHFPMENIGARLVEINPSGEIVWEMHFNNNDIYKYSIYQAEKFALHPLIFTKEEIKLLPDENLGFLYFKNRFSLIDLSMGV